MSALPALLCLAGLVVFFHPTLFSWFGRIQGDLGDTRFNNYVLEHTYRWLLGAPPHRSLWDMPIFYPARGTLFYSDVLVGAAPIYWLLRALGAPPDTAFQLWMPAVCVLNFTVFYLMLRSAAALPVLASAGGAFLFSFAASRAAQLSHPQLLPQFYLAAAAWASLRIYQRAADGRPAGGAVIVAAAALAAQAYTAFYPLWFFAFFMTLLTVWLLVRTETRRVVVSAAKNNAMVVVFSAAAAAAALYPLAAGYQAVVMESGYREFGHVQPYLAPAAAWFMHAPFNVVYGWSHDLSIFRSVEYSGEKYLAVGFITTVCIAAGAAHLMRSKSGAALLLASASLVAVITVAPNDASLWPFAYLYLPGAGALRVVSRGGLLLLFPGAAAFAYFLARRSAGIGALIVALCAVEQLTDSPAFDKDLARRTIAQIEKALVRSPHPCSSFILLAPGGAYPDWKYHNDAMGAALAAGLPTLNGYSGNYPPAWDLERVRPRGAAQEQAVLNNIRGWLQHERLSERTVCVVRRFRLNGNIVMVSPCCEWCDAQHRPGSCSGEIDDV